MPQKTKGLISHQTLYHFCALFVKKEYHHQNYPLAVRLPVCLPEWHVVQLARLVLGLSSLAVLPARSHRIDGQSGCLTFVKHRLEFLWCSDLGRFDLAICGFLNALRHKL